MWNVAWENTLKPFFATAFLNNKNQLREFKKVLQAKIALFFSHRSFCFDRDIRFAHGSAFFTVHDLCSLSHSLHSREPVYIIQPTTKPQSKMWANKIIHNWLRIEWREREKRALFTSLFFIRVQTSLDISFCVRVVGIVKERARVRIHCSFVSRLG